MVAGSAAGTSDDGELRRSATDSVVAELGERAHGDLDALERLDPTDEHQQWRIAEPEGAAGCRLVARGEQGVFDAGRDDLDPVGLGAVEALELAALGEAVGGDHVAAADHLGLGVDATLRFGVAGHGLHASEGVEGGDQRQIELVLDPMTGHAREPVVGMHDVGAAAGHDVGADLVGEALDDVGQRFLRQIGIAGGDVDHLDARLDVDDGGQIIGPAPHVDRAVRPPVSQRRDELADVDVHAPRVARSRLGQRRGVQRQHGDASMLDAAAGGAAGVHG